VVFDKTGTAGKPVAASKCSALLFPDFHRITSATMARAIEVGVHFLDGTLT
jgi:hypothetical protein